MPRITKRLVDNSFPKEKEYTVWDNEIKGFGCRILPTGYKTYVFYYRSPVTRKSSYIKIGVHGNYTPDMARDRAKQLTAEIARNIDPKEQKRVEILEEQTLIRFDIFWEIFTKKYIHENHKPLTIKNDQYRIKNHILPFFKEKLIGDINQKDILAFKDSLLHIKNTFTKCSRLLSVAFNQAELWGYRPKGSNPCVGVPKVLEKKMENYLTDEQLKRLENILTERSQVGLASPYIAKNL